MSKITVEKHPILFYILNNKRSFVIGMLFLFATNFLDASTPLILKAGIDSLQNANPLHSVEEVALVLLLSMAALSWTRFAWRVFWGKFHTFAAEDLRNRVFFHYTKLGPSFYVRSSVGELMSLITNDVNAFRQGIGPGLLILLDGISILFIIVPMMISLNAEWVMKTLIFVPFVPFLIWKIMKWIHSAYKVSQDRLSEMTGVSQEIVGGIRVIKTFAQEQNRTQYFNSFSAKVEAANNKLAFVDNFYNFVTQFGLISGTVILFYVGAPEVVAGKATIGTFVAFQSYISRMIWPMSALGLGISYLQKAMASFARIKTLFDEQPDIRDEGQSQISEFDSLEVKHLNFAYSNNVPVLRDISFAIKKGQTIGITGPVGAGKSTLVSLLTRLFLAPKGSIFINDRMIEDYSLESLRRTLVLIPQEAFLFSETIEENLAFGMREAAQLDQLNSTLESVDLKQEVEHLPMKLKSQLGERGVNLSGGQKQRLTIGRGLILEAPVLIFDDTLSAVDTKTEHNIQQKLWDQNRNQTKIIISHRISTLEKADKILVLRDGQVEAFNSHKELMRESSTYQKMCFIQGYGDGSHTQETLA